MTLQEMYRAAEWRRFRAQELKSGNWAIILGPSKESSIYIGYWESTGELIQIPSEDLTWTNMITLT